MKAVTDIYDIGLFVNLDIDALKKGIEFVDFPRVTFPDSYLTIKDAWKYVRMTLEYSGIKIPRSYRENFLKCKLSSVEAVIKKI